MSNDSLFVKARTLDTKQFISFVIDNHYKIYSLSFDSAIAMTAEAKQLALTNGWTSQAAYASLYHGVATYLRGDYKQALPSYLYALHVFDSLENHRGIARTCNEMAVFYHKQKQLDDAYNALDKAETAAKLAHDEEALGTTYSHHMSFLVRREKHKEAYPYMMKVFEIRKRTQDSVGLGYIYLDIANYKLINDQLDESLELVNKSTEIRKRIGDNQGVAVNTVIKGEFYFQTGNFKKAIPFFEKAIALATPIGYTDLIRFGYDMLQQSYVKLGDYKNAYENLQKNQIFNDSIYNVEKSKALLSLQTQYETEKKEKEIELLSIENQLKVIEVKNADNRFYASLGGATILLLIGVLAFNRYKQKQQILLTEEKAINQRLGFKSLIEGEEKERKRIAQELHDGLGQLLSTARLNVSAMEDRVEQIVTKQWENSIKLIDEAVTEVRHISHNMMPNALISIGFEAAVREQAHIINDAGQVKIHTQLPEQKIDLPESEAIALYRVIQEVLNNAIKYAKAKNIWLTITNDRDLKVVIKDDGIGFDTSMIASSTGIGWRNIQSRIEILNGELQIHSEIGKGAEVNLKIAI
ncbi:sensor histidine kinase [Reichenbachiella carrageenanivorans]|uniref:histidine kinase n=1 Tax=Reichenbachiella carrageenanivorans TaxID=2979869 RepID=A0ABY6D0H1_9BACT|nr:sensor histidine kinase [Reichenbachiella carrageenanivorans]UXX79598.1 sensor histidine kinase [Reichenbachiella carrageenanivorans]